MNVKMAAMALVFSTVEAVSHHQYPVVLIPGSGSNQLEARLTPKYRSSSLLCNRWYPPKKDAGGWFRLWFDPTVLFGPFTKCFNKRMMTIYDPKTGDYHNAPGVETRIPHFGSTESLLYLNPNLKKITSYMEPLVNSLGKIGYIDGKNLFGAPYDFQYGLAAGDHPSFVASKFLSDLKNLIQSSSNSNGGKPVILLTHRLGGLFALQLLNRTSIPWRKQYIKHLVALSAPWGGTVDGMLTFASGNTLGVPLVDPLLVREEQRSSSSNMWLLPSPKVFDVTKPLVVTPKAKYSSSDIARFLQDIGFPEGVRPYETRVLPLVESFPAPNVPVTLIIGSGVKTAEELIYKDSDFDKSPEIKYGDGDGTVNLVSLLALESAWGGKEDQLIKVIKNHGVSHTAILKDEIALDRTLVEISSLNTEICSSSIQSF
ncbi:hypothetical protein DM860_013450 [Cuscuta australis]|uniref:Lecithin-cholesterol acyltransferase-like 1 n=1 Tax=Cuscuta australis TaxID=267555 RepID=A0A328D316_9ASTE|nr:hypothetical protein DM860_013450 [Cuscuta australis]